MENPILKWMIWGYAYFRKPPYVYRSIVLYFVLYIFVKVRTSYGDPQEPASSDFQRAGRLHISEIQRLKQSLSPLQTSVPPDS